MPEEEDEETVKRTTKRTILNKRVINIQKKIKEEEEPKELNLDIPICPIATTVNHLKNICNRNVLQYDPEDLYSIPPKEPVLIIKIKSIKKEKEKESEEIEEEEILMKTRILRTKKEKETEIKKIKIIRDEIAKKQEEETESRIITIKRKNKIIKNLIDDYSNSLIFEKIKFQKKMKKQ